MDVISGLYSWVARELAQDCVGKPRVMSMLYVGRRRKNNHANVKSTSVGICFRGHLS